MQASGGLVSDVALVKAYEKYFLQLARILHEVADISGTSHPYWGVRVVSGASEPYRNFLVVVNNQSNAPQHKLPDTTVATPELGKQQFGPFPWIWAIDEENEKLVIQSPPLLSDNWDPRLYVHLGAFTRNPSRPFEAKRPFRQVKTRPNTYGFSQSTTNYFCHSQYTEDLECETCIQFVSRDSEPLEVMRSRSHFYKDAEEAKELKNDPVLPDFGKHGWLTYEQYVQELLTEFERGVSGDFLNQHDTLQVAIDSKFSQDSQASVRVIGRGQFSVVFSFENVMQGLALRRFPGFRSKEDADGFRMTHEAALHIYDEMKLHIESTRLIDVPTPDGQHTVYMLQRRLRHDELAEFYLEGLFEHGPQGVAKVLQSQGIAYNLTYAEALIHIIQANIVEIYENLISLNGDDSSLSICSDAKPDNYAVNFDYEKKWYRSVPRKEIETERVEAEADLTDFHPCTLVLYEQVLFDGGPEGVKLRILLGRNPFDDFKGTIRKLPDARRLITKVLANIAYHGGDSSEQYMHELVDRTRVMLWDHWVSNPMLRESYVRYRLKQWGIRTPPPKSPGLPPEKLFFDLDELTAEDILQYRKKSERGNLRLKLHYLLLKMAGDIDPDRFGHRDYIPVDYQQDWWLKAVEQEYKSQLRGAIQERLQEVDSKSPQYQPSVIFQLDETTEATKKLFLLIETILKDEKRIEEAKIRRLKQIEEAKIRRLMSWYILEAKTLSWRLGNNKSLAHEFQQMMGDSWIAHLNSMYKDKLRTVAKQSVEIFTAAPNMDDSERVEADPNLDGLFQQMVADSRLSQGKQAPEVKSKLSIADRKHSTILTGATSETVLLTEGYSASPLTKQLLDKLLAQELNLPLVVKTGTAFTFPEAFARVIGKTSWKAARDNILQASQGQLQSVIPLPNLVSLRVEAGGRSKKEVHQLLLRLDPGIYDSEWLARQVLLIPPQDDVHYPRYDGRNTLIQAIKTTINRSKRSKWSKRSEPRPLVVIDLSAAVEEAGAGRGSARVILFETQNFDDVTRVIQRSISSRELSQLLYGQQCDTLVRVLRQGGQDHWFVVKPLASSPSPGPSQAVKGANVEREETPPARFSSHSGSSVAKRRPLNRITMPENKRIRLESSVLTGSGHRQVGAPSAEDQARLYIISFGLVIAPIQGDHFCLYRSLARLLRANAVAASLLMKHLAGMLRHLIQVLPAQQHEMTAQDYEDIVTRLYSNIIFLALQNQVSRTELRRAIDACHFDSARVRRVLLKILRQLMVYWQFHAGVPINPLELWQQLINGTSGDAVAGGVLDQLLVHAGNNAGFDMILANGINELVLEADAVANPHQFFETIVNALANEWELGNVGLQHHELFFAMGVQAMQNVLQNQTPANWELLNGFLPTQPGQGIWANNFMLHDLFMPMLENAGIWQPVLVLHPVEAHNNQGIPLLAHLISPGDPNQGIVDPTAIPGHLQNDNLLILFNGGPGLEGDILQGGHWQPVLNMQGFHMLADQPAMSDADMEGEDTEVLNHIELDTPGTLDIGNIGPGLSVETDIECGGGLWGFTNEPETGQASHNGKDSGPQHQPVATAQTTNPGYLPPLPQNAETAPGIICPEGGICSSAYWMKWLMLLISLFPSLSLAHSTNFK
ncbi:MAG: hypothetical protein ACR2PT_14080 [Endozoicomonas sp.]